MKDKYMIISEDDNIINNLIELSCKNDKLYQIEQVPLKNNRTKQVFMVYALKRINDEILSQTKKDSIPLIPLEDFPTYFNHHYKGWIDTFVNRKILRRYINSLKEKQATT